MWKIVAQHNLKSLIISTQTSFLSLYYNKFEFTQFS